MRFYFTVIICFILKGSVIAQKIEPFGEQKFGIRNKITGKVLIYPKYERIVDYNDSLIIVQSDNLRFAVVDTLDKIVIPFSGEELLFEKFNKEHLGQIIEKSTSAGTIASYYIDKNRNCIPYDYCLCPKGKQLTDSVPRYLRLVQTGYSYFLNNRRDSAFYFFDKAIDANPNNAYVYYARASFSMTNNKGQLIKNKDSIGSDELKLIIANLDKAYKLKTSPLNYLNILNLKRDVARFYLKDKALTDSIDRESKKYNPTIGKIGLHLNAGVAYSNGLETELGLSYAILSRNERFWHKPYITNGIILIGCSYLKNISQKVDGYKFYLLSSVKPINFSLCPILFTDYKRSDWVLRPELGLGYESFSFTLGYNLFINGEMYKELNCVSLNIRYYLPLNNNKYYTVR